ncbi:MAG: NUDIX domain-containing protein [Candidatus Micrarchaeota archaeon]|nr:NUDIX domain-containing protein [Candidatus Micrarchaeota archaeon]
MKKPRGLGQKYPEVTVGAVIRDRRGKVLFIRSPKWFGKLTIPGGHVELGETREGALEREVREETGLTVRVGRLLNSGELIFSKEFIRPGHFIFFDYLCSVKGGKLKPDGREVTEAVWLEPREAMRLGVDSFTGKTLGKLLGGRE